jgi:hypothetical protein
VVVMILQTRELKRERESEPRRYLPLSLCFFLSSADLFCLSLSSLYLYPSHSLLSSPLSPPVSNSVVDDTLAHSRADRKLCNVPNDLGMSRDEVVNGQNVSRDKNTLRGEGREKE